MENNQHDIDIVYLWVDGNDPAWRKKRDALTGNAEEFSSAHFEGRHADNA